MAASLVDASCVVVANAHNPSIVNPDWLRESGVLPDEAGSWELAAPAITTPPMSHVGYQNAVEILLTSGQLVVGRRQMADIASSSVEVLKMVAINYVRTLRHIPYTAVGTNFAAMIECPDAQSRLVEQFGGGGRWRQGLDEMAVQLVHELDVNCRRQVEIRAATVPKSEHDESTPTQALLLAANYHRATKDDVSTVDALQRVPTDLADFHDFMTVVKEGSSV